MRHRTIFPRCALVYMGGMRATRWLDRLASAICVGCAIAFARSAHAFGGASVVVVSATCAIAILVGVGNRLARLHSVAVTPRGWMLLPIVGQAKCMAPTADVYEHGEDVVAVGIDGRTTLLGVDRFPFRDRALVRRSLVRALRGPAAFQRRSW
jgi:hypothetical protein